MFGMDLPRLHATLNDLPAALLLAAVLFDLAGWLMKRESLLWAGIWSLWIGVIGGWASVIVGLLAESRIDHGDAIHLLMQQHKTWGIITMSLFTAVLAWKLWRRFQLSGGEDKVLKVIMLVALAIMVRVGQLGGKLVFEHAAGIPTSMMQTEIENRVGDHQHAPGTAPHEHADSSAAMDSASDTTKAKPHEHAPGTAPHDH